MKDQEKKTISTDTNTEDINKAEENILDRDQSGPVSVSTDDDGKPSYTHNVDKSDPIDPHLSDDNPPDSAPGSSDSEDNTLDRDKASPVSVSTEDNGKPSYTHNADDSEGS